ncbi:FliA/WhiG family RNA polymerase sigma factor [Anopheles sinensis]|uniref:FliA/WhiG family RNA polymerase sigma factor n=1 Tax=Anopheles sinensis TaxID=74873 RepID=A0A084WTF3_ANOSI|nr:FliA/WhiG family RNA polymerase sigma factor [Anopheles sinensis]
MPQTSEPISGMLRASGNIQTCLERKAPISQEPASIVATNRDESNQYVQTDPEDPSNIEVELAYYKQEAINLQRTVDELLNELGEREKKVQQLTNKLGEIKYRMRCHSQPSV